MKNNKISVISFLLIAILSINFSFALTSLQIGLPNASLDNLVPYTGASQNVNLNGKNLTALYFYGFLNYSYIQNVPSFGFGNATTNQIFALNQSILLKANATQIDALNASKITGSQVPGFEEDPLFVTDQPIIVYQSNCAVGFVVQNLTGGGGASQCIPAGTGSGNATTDQINALNTSIQARAFPGTCAAGFVVQNTTTGGVECVPTGSGSGNVSGSGITNYLPLWSSNNLLTSSIIYQNFSFIGIGQNKALVPFHVSSSAGSTPTVLTGTSAIFENNDFTTNRSRVAIISGNSGISSLDFGDTLAQARGFLFYNHATEILTVGSTAIDTIYVTNGSTGFGITSPQANIHSSVQSGNGFIGQFSATNNNGYVMLFRKARGSAAVPLNASVGDSLGGFQAQAYSNETFKSSAGFTFTMQGLPSTGTNFAPPGGINFLTSNGAGSLAQRASLNANGSYALGVNLNAQAQLHQDGGTATASYHKFTAGSTTGQTSTDGIDLGITGTGNFEIRNREFTNVSVLINNTNALTIFDNRTVLINNLSGTGNAYVCVNSNGLLYRSNVSCV